MKQFAVSLTCDGSGTWDLVWVADEMGVPIASGSSQALTASCSPFSLTFTLDLTGVCGVGAASVDVTITI
jgi:hypothetical protein